MTFGKLNEFLNRLERTHTAYRVYKIRSIAVLVEVFVPGEHWEVEFLDDGTIEVERYTSDGRTGDESTLTELWSRLEGPENKSRQKPNYML